MHTRDLDYELPPELIAQHPAEQRGASQLMVLHADAPAVAAVARFDTRLLDELRPDDLIVVNNSRVLNARLLVTRPTGGVGELLLLEPAPDQPPPGGRGSHWLALGRPARSYRDGMVVETRSGSAVTCVERTDSGEWIVRLPAQLDDVPEWLSRNGELPLPPYIHSDGQPDARYQTIYSVDPGSVAAPTAGLHFDDDLWGQIQDRYETAAVTLHVGAGTFQPVREGSLDEHAMHAERFTVGSEADVAIRAALEAGRRVVSVGTTTTRVLETVYGDGQWRSREPGAVAGSTDIFITPGYEFGCVGALLTNFHLPQSTLLALVMAFAGVDSVRVAYASAIRRGMRFYSFGDAMFIHGRQVAR